MRIFGDFFIQIRSLKRNIQALLCIFFLLTAVVFVILGIGSIISMVIIPLFVLLIPGYLFAEILFKCEKIVDKLLIGYGVSSFNSMMFFYTFLFLYNKSINSPQFSHFFLAFLITESLVLLLIDYLRSKKTVFWNSDFKVRPINRLAKNHLILLGILIITFLLGQFLFVKIYLYWPDEHQYVYTSRNLLQANYSFTPIPPVMDPRLWTPRYVYIGLNTIFYLFFGLELTAPLAFVVISSFMLILATFALGNTLYGKNVGLIASLYLALNPIFWGITRRIVPDMVVAALLWSGIYFMIKACKHNEDEIRWQYIPISGLFLGLAVFVKLTVVFAIPTFFVILIIFRGKISKKRTSLFYMICLAGIVSFLGAFLASDRYTGYLFFLLRNFSYFLNRWDWNVAYISMIEPLLIISPVFVFCILGILFNLKQRERGQGMVILFAAWISYFFLPLILPDQAVDPRHVFPAHVGPSIMAAFGTIEVTKRGKLWERMLYLLIFVQVFYETGIREYVRISQASRVLIELVLVLLVLMVLRNVVQKIKLQSSQTIPKARAVVLLGLVFVLSINGHALNSLGWSGWTRRIRHESLSATQTSLEKSGNWLSENTDESSIFMTNEFIRLPYYAEFRITYPLPGSEFSFLQDVENKNIEYIILFWGIWSEIYPYMHEYIENPSSSMIEMMRWEYITEDGRELGFVIYKMVKNS